MKLLCLVLGMGVAPAWGQLAESVSFADAQGTTESCTGAGPLAMPVVKKCIAAMEAQGFLREKELGVTGMTLGTTGKDDGVIVKIELGSAAEQAGLAVGDAIVKVEDKPVQPTPGTIATERSFGARGESVKLSVLRAGKTVELMVVRAEQEVKDAPKGSMFIAVHPLINWKGQFVPCMGAGPLAPAAIGVCTGRWKKDGYIKVSELGTTGYEVDTKRTDAAVIAVVRPGSPAEKAGVMVGDQIVAVDGQPLVVSLGDEAKERFFAKGGTAFHVVVRHGGAEKTVVLTLAAKPQG